MTDTIKITSLSPMGTSIPGSSLTPVVDMSGTPTTKKATIANIANAILSQAGNGYAYAAKANLANIAGQSTTVTQNAQPNITSVGTLTSLTVSGETVLGPVGNVVITGGTNGYVLQTDGTGNLSWTAQTGNGGGNGTPGGANTQVQFNDGGSFGGDSGLTFNKTTNNLTVGGTVIISSGDILANQMISTGGSNIDLRIGNLDGPVFSATVGGAFRIPGGHVLESNFEGEFEIKSDYGIVISSDISNTNQHFSFRTDGVFHSPSNVEIEGSRLSVGLGAPDVTLEAPTLVVNANSNVYVQAALLNENANGSADWVAYGTGGDDTGGWTDFGFTGYDFSDPNYSVTSEGDGYLFVQGYANGTGGGNLVLATGGQGTDKNIIFATGGFSNSNIKATLYNANGTFDVVGNVSANWVIGDYVSGNATPLHHLPTGNLVGVDGNSSNILYGNGAFAAVSGGNPFNQDLNTTDNVTFANITSTDAIRFSNSSNVVGALGYAPNYVSIEGYGSNTVNITANDIYTWTFDGNGNLTIPSGGYINFVNTGGITQAVNEDLRFTVSDDEQDGWAIESIVNDGAGNNLTRMQVMYDGVAINTDIPTNNYRWDFRDTGEFDVPKSIRGPVGGNLVISIGDQSGSNTFIDLQTRSYVGDALISNIRIANPDVTISTSSGAYNWAFGGNGLLTFPGTPRIDTSTNNFEVQAAQAINFEANTVVNIYTDTSNNGWQWQFGDDGNTGFPGNLNYNGIASPSPSINGFSSASFNMNLTADQVYMSDNAISTVGGSSNLILNTQYGTATDSFIQVPTFQDGGEELIIKNGYTGSLGIRVQTTTGNFTFIGNNFSVPGDITATNIGNIASTNYDGNASNVLYGNGSFAAAPSGSSYGNSNVVTLLSSFGSNTISTTGNVAVGAMTASGKIGYASGSSVTQTTNRGQGVNITALAGTIVTVSDTIAAGDADYFFVTNPSVDPTTDIVLVQVTSYNPGTYAVIAQPTSSPSNGFLLSITNITGFSSPTEAITIRFMVIKSPNA